MPWNALYKMLHSLYNGVKDQIKEDRPMTLKQTLRRMKPGQHISFRYGGTYYKESTGTFRHICEKRVDHIPQKWIAENYKGETPDVYDIF